MALDRPLHAGIRWSVPLGAACCLLAVVGVLDLAGTFDDAAPPAARETRVTLGELAFPVFSLLLCLSGFALAVAIAAAGAFPTLPLPGLPPALVGAASLAAVVVPAAFLAAVAALFRLGAVLGFFVDDDDGTPRPLRRRHGFWVVAVSAALFLPTAGSHSLVDPWETHYGEVAREMLARSDWISTWWAQDGFFWSKPVLGFWIQALSMGALGVGYAPDAMLRGSPTPWPEWAVRVPIVLFAIVAAYALYKGVARVFGRRAGLFGALVLASSPQWALLTHQTMADLPFVASLSAAMGLVLYGLHTAPDERCHVARIDLGGGKSLSLTALHGVLGMVLLAALPQIFYLVSRNVEIVTHGGFGFHLRGDRFWAGSFGNCHVPGNDPCGPRLPAHPSAQPSLQALGWSVALCLLIKLQRGERRVARVAFLGAFFFAALSTLGKGPAGLALPALCVLSYLALTGRGRALLSMEIAGGILVVLAVAMPWYVAMYERHGMPFVDRLIFHDMWKRALTHVHDTNEGDDTSFRFYVWQLGYALFPFTGLLPLALVSWVREPDDAGEGEALPEAPARAPGGGRGGAAIFLALWFLFAFALFSAMLTKFHHYIFPAVPPAAMLVGVLLDRLVGPDDEGAPATSPHRDGRAIGLLFTGAAALLVGASLLSRGSFLGPSTGVAHPVVAGLLLAVGVATLTFGTRLLRRGSDGGVTLAEGASMVGAAALVLAVGRDLFSRPTSDVPGQARLLHLFTYQYQRPWPDSLDFRGTFVGATLVLVVALAVSAVPRLRRAGLGAFVAASLLLSFWNVNVYFVSASPHWGQRELYATYYRLRSSPKDPVVAYQLNWKGENFYTGNHVAAFVSTGEKLKAWVSAERRNGVRTIYFVTEHRRMGNLQAELGPTRGFDLLTDEVLNNKFGLARATFD